jgi:PRTRC genetic system protein E
MFVELMPLLAGRTVMITVARENDKTLRVNVIPTTKIGEGENPALTTPLSYTGTPEELDAELGRELAGYVECHRTLGSTLAAARAEMDAAAKVAQEEARKKTEERKKKAEKPTDKPAYPAPSTVSVQPAPPATASLFGDSQPAAS